MTNITAINFLSSQNGLGDKPNEDYFVCAEAEQIFIVCDGISRYVPVGEPYPEPSPAAMAARLVATTLQEFITAELRKNNTDFITLIKKAVSIANRELGHFNAQSFEQFDFKENDRAGTTLAMAVISNNTIYTAAVGDSMLQIYNTSGLKALNPNQTQTLEAHYPEPMSFENMQLVRSYRNNKQAKFPFGALTGEEAALDFVEYSTYLAKANETLFIYSDGVQAFFDRFTATQALLSMEEIDALACQYCLELGKKLDDRTMIRIDF